MYYVRYEFSELRSAAECDATLVAFRTSYGLIFSFLPPSDRRGHPLASAARLLAAAPDVAADDDEVGIAICDSLAELESLWYDTDVDVLLYRSSGGSVSLGYLEHGYRYVYSVSEYYSLARFLRDFADCE